MQDVAGYERFPSDDETWDESGVRWATATSAATQLMVQRLQEDNERLRQRVKELLPFQQLAYIDTLTGLGNRRRFDERLHNEWARWKRYRVHFSLVMIDLDEFKQINDTWGHAFGDSALKALAEHIQDAVREVDVVCRVGGDEFALILPNTDAAGAQVLVSRIESALHTAPLNLGGGAKLQLRASFGVATSEPHITDTVELLEQADAAMYQSKRGCDLDLERHVAHAV